MVRNDDAPAVDTRHLENPEECEPDVDVDDVALLPEDDGVNRRVVATKLMQHSRARRDALPRDGDDSERDEPDRSESDAVLGDEDPLSLHGDGDDDDDDDDGSDLNLDGVDIEGSDGGAGLPRYAGTRRSHSETEPVAPVTTDENVVSLHGRVARVEDAGESFRDDVVVYVVGQLGTVKVRLFDGLTRPELNAGEEVVMTDVALNDEDGGERFEQTPESDVVVVGEDATPAGFWMRERSRLVNADKWFVEGDDDYDAIKRTKQTLVDEHNIETPYGGDDVFIYVTEGIGPDTGTGTWSSNGGEIIKEILDEHLPERRNNGKTKGMVVSAIRDKTRVPEDKWDPGRPDDEDLKWSVGVKNGVIDLRTGELHEHGPEWELRQKLPVEYKPDEYDGLGDELDWFLDTTMGSEEDRESFMFMVGHALCRCYPVEAIWPIIGPGGNGKTRLIEVLDCLLGNSMRDYNLGIMTGDSDFGAGPLRGGNMVIDDDATDVKMHSTGLLKKHSGGRGGQINVKDVEMDGKGYENYATIAFNSNSPPMFSDKTEGMRRRMHPILMPHQFSNDPNDGKKAAKPKTEIQNRIQQTEEIEALLTVAVEYAGKMHDKSEVMDGRTADEREDIYEAHSDNILRFWSECMESENGARVTKNAVYETYVKWADKNGVDPKAPGGRNGFWPLSNQCYDVSFNSEDKWLDGSRAVEHVKFGSDAMEHAPDWVRDEWESELDDDESTLANRLDRTTALADLDGGYCTTEARVIFRGYVDERDESGTKLTLEDSTTAMDAVCWKDEFDGINVGDKVRFTRAVCKENNYGVPQILLSGSTEIEVVEEGPLSGTEESEDAEDNVDSDSVEDEILDAINEHADGRCEIDDVHRAVEHDRVTVEESLDELKLDGAVYEPETGVVKST